MHVGDAEYAEQRRNGTDELGFQPFTITLANPFKKEIKEYLVKHVPDTTVEQFLAFSRDRYNQELGNRFGNFTPDETHAFAEYDTWENFYTHWLERDGKQVFSKNIPLLFDHTPKIEHWTRKQSGVEVLPYQRLLITTYFVSKKQFFSFFIKEVEDSEMERIKLLAQSRVGLNINEFLTTQKKVTA